MKETPRVIIVEWHDAGSAATKEEAESIIRFSVGFQIAVERGHGVTLTMESDELSGVNFIPWDMVKSITPVG